jgi:hypothetical protein
MRTVFDIWIARCAFEMQAGIAGDIARLAV